MSFGYTPTEVETMEREASRFAVCLLMPEKMVRAWWKAWPDASRKEYGRGPKDLLNDDLVKDCVRAFKVPVGVAVVRLTEVFYGVE